MKQTISTIYPPPPQTVKKQQHMQKKNTKKLNGFQRGSQVGRHPPPPPSPHPSPAFLSFYFAMQHLKYLNGISLGADGCPTLCAGWDRVCPCLVPSSSSLELIRFLRFCKILVRKMHITIQQNISCDAQSCADPEILSDEVQFNSDTLFLDEWSEESKYH